MKEVRVGGSGVLRDSHLLGFFLAFVVVDGCSTFHFSLKVYK